MNRSTFLKSLLALPFVGRAALRSNPQTKLPAPGPIAQPLTSWKPAQSPEGTIDLLPLHWVEGYGMLRVTSPIIREVTTFGPQAVYMETLQLPYFVSSELLQEVEALGEVYGEAIFKGSMEYLEKRDMRYIYGLYVSNMSWYGPQYTGLRRPVIARCAQSAERRVRGLENQLRYAQSLVADGPSLKDILAS